VAAVAPGLIQELEPERNPDVVSQTFGGFQNRRIAFRFLEVNPGVAIAKGAIFIGEIEDAQHRVIRVATHPAEGHPRRWL
jgi:hypothetical protein